MEQRSSGCKENDAYTEYLRLFYSNLYPDKTIIYSGTYTGSMLVPHEPVPGFLEKPITVNTKDFFDIGLKAAYDFKLYKSMNLQVNAGVQNIFNAYQNDFDKGADRDSGYIYGPSLPRSFFAGVKISYWYDTGLLFSEHFMHPGMW